jgi:hypothetical protein
VFLVQGENRVDILENVCVFCHVNITEREILRHEIAALKARLIETKTKDLSFVTLVQYWTGTSASCAFQNFFDSVDITADIRNWDE